MSGARCGVSSGRTFTSLTWSEQDGELARHVGREGLTEQWVMLRRTVEDGGQKKGD